MPFGSRSPQSSRARFAQALAELLLRGAGLDVLWTSVLPMAAIGVALFALGLLRFRRQFT